MNRHLIAGAIAAIALSATAAQAECVTKAANATSGTEASAKWFVMETMVQAVSWGLWPGYVANSKVEGYTVKNEKYSCKPEGAGVFCRGSATFCKNK
ncbi:MAG: hypothetical protein K2Y05_02870 [Hyphomicrobiaceae bacterium]|nr:hypothetical protein [Hyphomicrobiaceae bacterium]